MKFAVVLALLLLSGCTSSSSANQSTSSPTSPARFTSHRPVPTFTNTPDSERRNRRQPTKKAPTPIPRKVQPTATQRVLTPTPSPPMATINRNANVRGGPGTNYPIIGSASPGQSFPITGKNASEDWWEISFSGNSGWIYGQLITATASNNVEVVNVISLQPTSIPPTATPITAVATHCVYNSEPAIPSPGPDVYDCDAWGIAYYLVSRDRPEVLFVNFNANERLRKTYIMYNLLQSVASNCNATVVEISGVAEYSAQYLEKNADFVPNEILIAPRAYMLGGMTTMYGTLLECQTLVVDYLDGLFE